MTKDCCCSCKLERNLFMKFKSFLDINSRIFASIHFHSNFTHSLSHSHNPRFFREREKEKRRKKDGRERERLKDGRGKECLVPFHNNPNKHSFSDLIPFFFLFGSTFTSFFPSLLSSFASFFIFPGSNFLLSPSFISSFSLELERERERDEKEEKVFLRMVSHHINLFPISFSVIPIIYCWMHFLPLSFSLSSSLFSLSFSLFLFFPPLSSLFSLDSFSTFFLPLHSLYLFFQVACLLSNQNVLFPLMIFFYPGR